jgi:hypothetical protein
VLVLERIDGAYCTWRTLASALVHLEWRSCRPLTSTFVVPPAGLEPAAYRLGDRDRSSRAFPEVIRAGSCWRDRPPGGAVSMGSAGLLHLLLHLRADAVQVVLRTAESHREQELQTFVVRRSYPRRRWRAARGVIDPAGRGWWRTEVLPSFWSRQRRSPARTTTAPLSEAHRRCGAQRSGRRTPPPAQGP